MAIESLAELALLGGHDIFQPRQQDGQRSPAPDDDYWYQPRGFSYGGAYVNSWTAIQAPAVTACIRVLSGDLSKVPLLTYRKTPEGREKATNHYLYNRLRWSANPYMTALRFKRLMEVWVLLEGNAYAELEINGRGQVTALWPWRPDRVTVRQGVDGPIYCYQGSMGKIERPWYMMLHLRGLEIEGFFGLNPIESHRKTIGLATQQEEYAANFYANGARPGGILTLPSVALKDKDSIRQEWNSTFGGTQNAHKTAVFTEGTKYESINVKQSDAEYIQTRRMGIYDICRIYGVSPHKIAELERATFNNIEELNLDYVSGTLGDHFANWEQEIQFSCLSEREQTDGIYVEFLPEMLLRGRFAEQMAGYSQGVTAGIFDRNEVREKFNMNRRPGAEKLLVQQQMIPIEDAGKHLQKDADTANEQPTQ